LKREAVILEKSDDGKRAIYVDQDNATEIIAYLGQDERHRKKFRFIVSLLLGGFKSKLYGKEHIDQVCRDVTAMKLFKGQENDRIYCKEIVSKGTFVIVACEMHLAKKSKKLSHKEISIIQKVATYEYDI
jgi:hypothetical protein